MAYLGLRLLRRAGLLKYLRTSTTVEVAGRRYRVPIVGGSGLANLFRSDAWMDELYRRLLPGRRGTFLDVGANVGQTLLRVKAVRPDMPYVGFEPNLTAAQYVSRLVEVNGLEEATLLPVGLSDALSVVELRTYSDSDVDQTASIVPDLRPGSPQHASHTVLTLGPEALSLEPLRGAISAVKVDVEGAELEVLQSLRPLLQRSRAPVLFEVLPAYGAHHPERIRRQDDIYALFTSLDYVVCELRHDAPLPAAVPIGGFEIHDDLDRTDFLALPREEAAAIRARLTAEAPL